ncbi:MAG: AI-2E family transporter, partial [Gammaproteobacteria bacterium]|nr:AI-2E family transporter [Gammaproteobacteria bacterium]
MQVVTDWFRRHFSNPEVVFLALLLVVLFAVVVLWGDMLAPVLAAIVIAYLLEGVVRVFERVRLPRVVAVLI